MSAPKMGKTALEYMDASKREQAAGNHIEAAALMWQATQATFAALADAHGMELKSLDEDDLIMLARALEADGSVPKWRYRGGLSPGSLPERPCRDGSVGKLSTGLGLRNRGAVHSGVL